MKLKFRFLAALLVMPVIAWAEPERDLSKLSEPPRDAPAGERHDGVEIGLWTERPVYGGGMVRNVWMHARKDGDSATTIGVEGTLYKNSFLHITSNGEEVAKLPLHGFFDGPMNPTSVAGGLSAELAALPSGEYRLFWTTDSHRSNTITIGIEGGELDH